MKLLTPILNDELISNSPHLEQSQKYDPKKSSGTFNRIFKFLSLTKNDFTKLEDGLIKTINNIKEN